jgi:hypothetical protein
VQQVQRQVRAQVQPSPDRWVAVIEVRPDPVDDDITASHATQIGARHRFRCQTQVRALVHAAHLRTVAEPIGHHVGMPLSERALLNAAGDRSYARLCPVRPRVAGDSRESLRVGSGQAGLCKHLVAVGLAVIDSGAVDDVTGVASALEATVQAMDVDELRELVLTLAHRDGEVRRILEFRATAASGDDTTAKAEFEACAKRPEIPRIRRLSRVLRGRGRCQPSTRRTRDSPEWRVRRRIRRGRSEWGCDRIDTLAVSHIRHWDGGGRLVAY